MKNRLHVNTDTLAVWCCFLLVGLLGVYLKFGMLTPEWGEIARFLGHDERWQLGFFDRLGFYRNDIIVGLLLMPIVATAVFSFVFRRYRVGAAVVVCALVSVVLFYESKARFDVGRYVSGHFILDSVTFMLAEPGRAKAYVNLADIAKLAILLLAFGTIWALARLARRHERAQPERQRKLRSLRSLFALPIAIIWLAAVIVVPVSAAHYAPSLSVNTGSLKRVADTLLIGDATHVDASLDLNQAYAAMRGLTHTPSLDENNPLVGAERNSNVLLFVMETGPAQALDLAVSGQDLPGAGQLFGHAFVTRLHYTTYPFTRYAVYSILSGMYPQGSERRLRQLRNATLPGLMSAVSGAIPVRRIYMPSPGTSGTTLHAFVRSPTEGQALYVADEHVDDPLRPSAEQRAHAYIAKLISHGGTFDDDTRAELHKKLALDFQALAKLKQDIVDAAQTHQRFVMGFFPQIGHGPWIALHNEPTVLARGRHLMLLQDQWLAELVDTLRKTGQLDHTIIVFTADHGIRTRKEDPSLPVGKISDYMFRVPLLIYAPHSLQHTVFIDVPNSHIDVAPTVLALLGNTGAAQQMEGVPLWQRSARDRLYFWAGAYGGADGFEENGQYFMRQEMSGAVFDGDYADFYQGFPDKTLVASNDPTYGSTQKALTRAETLQNTIASRLIEGRKAGKDVQYASR